MNGTNGIQNGTGSFCFAKLFNNFLCLFFLFFSYRICSTIFSAELCIRAAIFRSFRSSYLSVCGFAAVVNSRKSNCVQLPRPVSISTSSPTDDHSRQCSTKLFSSNFAFISLRQSTSFVEFKVYSQSLSDIFLEKMFTRLQFILVL